MKIYNINGKADVWVASTPPPANNKALWVKPSTDGTKPYQFMFFKEDETGGHWEEIVSLDRFTWEELLNRIKAIEDTLVDISSLLDEINGEVI